MQDRRRERNHSLAVYVKQSVRVYEWQDMCVGVCACVHVCVGVCACVLDSQGRWTLQYKQGAREGVRGVERGKERERGSRRVKMREEMVGYKYKKFQYRVAVTNTTEGRKKNFGKLFTWEYGQHFKF